MMTEQAFHIEGAARGSRWLLTCDHATNRVPDWVNGGDLGIAPEDMARHIAYDVGAAGLTRALAERLDAPAILSDFSRLVIDPNRGEDDPTLLMRIYDGTEIPANREAGPDARARRLDRLYRDAAQAEPSPALDRAILAAATEAVRPPAPRRRPSGWRRWSRLPNC